ncbi:MAG: DUF6537 domain-containing protein [Polynucleobacter sp.]
MDFCQILCQQTPQCHGTKYPERVKSQFEGDFKVFYHLAPPLIAKRNEKGQLIKQKISPHMVLVFKVLAQFKFLRGTA